MKPEVLGHQAACTIAALGPGTEACGLEIGDRVIWLDTGGYAEYTAVSAAKTMKLAPGISDEDATASFLSGLTCLVFSHETYQVRHGDWILLHAAAERAGFLMIQILKILVQR